MSKTVLISKNVRLTYKVIAEEIFISGDGSITLFINGYGPNIKLPALTLNYLESLCSRFYFGGDGHSSAIADILLLNGALSSVLEYDDFYLRLSNNLQHQHFYIITSQDPSNA